MARMFETKQESLDHYTRWLRAQKFTSKCFSDVRLSLEEQRYERGKPKVYIERTLEILAFMDAEVIVEVGSMRGPILHPPTELHVTCCNDGHSSFIWALTGLQVYSVDAAEECRPVMEILASSYPNFHFEIGDGLAFLQKFDKPIDFLYLDAWDVVPGGTFAESHLKAYELARPKLKPTNLVVIDDTDVGDGGKGKLVVPQLVADGYEILATGRQTIALKRA